MTKRLELLGAAGSPYTRKMLGVLRFRHIPYAVFWGNGQVPGGYPAPKVRLLPTFFFPKEDADGLEAVTDSTPIIRRLEAEYADRSILPTDPILAFLNNLIEDYADEWLTKAMFHFRWTRPADWKNAGPLLVYWGANTLPEPQADSMAAAFTQRQIDRLYVVGSNDVTAETIETSYTRFVHILDSLLQVKGFVLGARPSSADFAIYGQLTQLAVIEPTSAAITKDASMRVRAWVDIMEDLSGLQPKEDDWFSPEEAKRALAPLLAEIGRVYAPFLLANGRAVMAGETHFHAEIDGRAWTQPTFSYQAKCLKWLQEDYGQLSGNARGAVDDMLAGSGCEALFTG